jgi:hypothetical protein
MIALAPTEKRGPNNGGRPRRGRPMMRRSQRRSVVINAQRIASSRAVDDRAGIAPHERPNPAVIRAPETTLCHDAQKVHAAMVPEPCSCAALYGNGAAARSVRLFPSTLPTAGEAAAGPHGPGQDRALRAKKSAQDCHPVRTAIRALLTGWWTHLLTKIWPRSIAPSRGGVKFRLSPDRGPRPRMRRAPHRSV